MLNSFLIFPNRTKIAIIAIAIIKRESGMAKQKNIERYTKIPSGDEMLKNCSGVKFSNGFPVSFSD